ncbi:MAG: MarC family protein, partial [Williamsia herbipolensis]|nr:MarC family protein [Williamsia herbipolensis]
SVSQADDEAGTYLAIAAAIVTVHLILATVLRFSTVLIRILGVGGVTLLAKIAGLLLAAIAVQLIANSIIGFVNTA